MTRNLHVFSGVLLGAIIASCVGEPSASGQVSSIRPTGQIPPYTVQAAELDETSGPRLAKALRAIDGVEDVELDLEARRANVQTRSGLFLYEPQVRAAFSSANVEFASFQPPSEALVTVYVVEAGGGGWGGVKVARAAFESLENVDGLFQNGTRATFTLKPGEWFDERALVQALQENKLTLDSYRRERRPRSTTAWVLGTEPFTWADTAGMVREALIDLPHVIDAYAGDEIVLHMAAPATIDERAVKKLLAGFEVEVDSIARDGAALF